jgi:hypothetical protein
MPLHLIKLCVGIPSVEDLRSRQAQRLTDMRARGEPARLAHITRMVPRRADELTDGGSLYWVIKGYAQARQAITGVEPFRDAEGVGRCRLLLGEELVNVAPRPLRAFQGWRYLEAKDAPADLATGAGEDMPEEMRRELAELGLL